MQAARYQCLPLVKRKLSRNPDCRRAIRPVIPV
ncbi:hypothetical protein MIZ01_0578 [Sideroxyarcus emersonii]|uniref:Uncharacterized protein n=1 Tax=Sideroxyarcus emersonii TaxID=2764705 RepID=A0AAN2BYJ7_9PROT|nr:hypothetical protein MIZ01_0578 [Sideroxyarcus emersonii]